MFYIVQMADFHFGGVRPSAETERDILKKMSERLQDAIPEDSEVVLCACGDYIDSKAIMDKGSVRALTEDEISARYQEAKEAIESTVIEPLREKYNLKVGLCVGNHDTTHINAMNQFSQAIIGKDIDKTYSIHLDFENVDFIFINSCPPSDCSHGEIDYDYLENRLGALSPDSAKYFVLHHTLISMDEHDNSSIRQAPRLIKLIDQYSIKAILHGHTHGQYIIRIGTEGCPIIGVGAAYVRDYPNVNSQFNLIRCGGGIPLSADNYQYHADLAANPDCDGFEVIRRPIAKENNFEVPIAKENNCFWGREFSRVYDELMKSVRAESQLYNVHLHVKSSFDEFCTDVKKNFGDLVELETLDRAYSYTELAEMWEDSQVDEEVLYFNHGKYFAVPNSSGTEFIVNELGKKRTTSRAVMVTVNTKNISETGPDAMLPLLLSIQAGFDRDQTTLHIIMNLRALEASRFLKINICEILRIAEQIYNNHPFKSIEVAISTFRVQIREQFGCFLKAKLDTEAQKNRMMVVLSSLIYSDSPTVIAENIKEITCLIQDKKSRSETVIVTNGIENLRVSIATVTNMLPDSKRALKCDLNEIHGCIEKLLYLLKELKENRERNAEQTADMNVLEERIQMQYDLLTDKFERLIQNDTGGTD